MNWIFAGMLAVGIIVSLLLGRGAEVTAAVLGDGAETVKMCLELAGTVCIWSGIMKVAERSGLCGKLSRLMSPIISFLFPGLADSSPAAASAVSMNITANLLGLGSAATPMALVAMREMDRLNRRPEVASDYMIVLTSLNTASFQLIPATVAGIRQLAGSAAPLDILPAVWISSAVSVTLAVSVAKLFCRRRGKHEHS